MITPFQRTFANRKRWAMVVREYGRVFQLVFANQGRNFYDSKEEAERQLKLFMDDGSMQIYWGKPTADFKVCEIECYYHGDAIGIYWYPEGEPTTEELIRDAEAATATAKAKRVAV